MSRSEGDADDALTPVFDCLANRTRRELLGFLHGVAPAARTPEEAVASLGPREGGVQRGRTPGENRRRTLRGLHHNHLPKLEAAGLIDREDDGVALGDHVAFRDAGITEAIAGGAAADPGSLDDLFGALADPRRRTILDTLSHQFQAIRTRTLAREVGARERGVAERALPREHNERALVSCRHNHFPELADAALIDYDPEAGTVEYAGHHNLRVPWMHSVFGPEFRGSLTGESEPDGIGTVEGREAVISYGQWLGERAEDELFCLFTHEDMLEAGCFARIVDAARRGVDVYLGTHDPTVREYVRENAPEVALWKPETDWVDLPVGGSRVGRLILADRESVMLGTLKRTAENGHPEETAIVADGAENSLVVMVRQLLGTRLEELAERDEGMTLEPPR